MRIPPIFKNFYVLTLLGFLTWMLFIDTNDLVSRFRMNAKLRQLKREKAYFEEKIQEVEKDKEELTTNRELLEKFAREKYLMKKPSEDLFVIEKK